MPVAVSYPGVYIEEIPSSVRTITGVATSIAAFVGWAPKGPTDSAELVLSWADFARTYGGLDARSPLGYAVSQFFSNGGSQAYIIRLAAGDAKPGITDAIDLTADAGKSASMKLSARSPGDWSKDYGILLKNQGTTGRFRLQVVYAPSGSPAPPPVVVESFENVSVITPDAQGRYVVDVINAQSQFVTVAITGTPTGPPASDITTPALLKNGDPGTVLTPRSLSSGVSGAFETAVVPGGGTTGVDLLLHVDLFNLLCVPGEADPPTLSKLEQFCHDHRAVLIADCFQDDTFTSLQKQGGPPSQITAGDNAANGAFYFPWLDAPDPLRPGVNGTFPPCGFVAGIYAETDSNRGVWKAPAGTEAGLTGVIGPHVALNDPENGFLNPAAVNCIRNFPVYGTVVWGARTTQGNDEIGSQWKYIPVRRLALFIEESLYRGTKWAVFEPNDEPLWSQLRLNVGAFMHELFRKGAFQGQTPKDAYFVKCDKETTTQNDINLGIVNVVVGFAPLKPAEFVVIQIQQMAGQIAT